jgi:hypothetical protein
LVPASFLSVLTASPEQLEREAADADKAMQDVLRSLGDSEVSFALDEADLLAASGSKDPRTDAEIAKDVNHLLAPDSAPLALAEEDDAVEEVAPPPPPPMTLREKEKLLLGITSLVDQGAIPGGSGVFTFISQLRDAVGKERATKTKQSSLNAWFAASPATTTTTGSQAPSSPASVSIDVDRLEGLSP